MGASDDIDAHVIGARVVVRADPGRDRVLVAAGDQRIDEPVARPALQIVIVRPILSR